ncbi:MAG TPA: hypothetical protein VGN72_12005 [Tepidisphaeraceae bacterium]|jgi:hypothetical protein|nr:hypothetical protein [Tepidisphaeraceae bacterium]
MRNEERANLRTKALYRLLLPVVLLNVVDYTFQRFGTNRYPVASLATGLVLGLSTVAPLLLRPAPSTSATARKRVLPRAVALFIAVVGVAYAGVMLNAVVNFGGYFAAGFYCAMMAGCLTSFARDEMSPVS